MSGGIAEGLETEPIVEDSSGRLFLRLVQGDAAEIIERLRETHADTQGRAPPR